MLPSIFKLGEEIGNPSCFANPRGTAFAHEIFVRSRFRKDAPPAAIDAFEAAGRDAQADREEFELDVIEEFMPDQLSEEELEEIVDDVIAEVGATSIHHLGRVMADVMPRVSGRADGSVVSQLVREKLA